MVHEGRGLQEIIVAALLRHDSSGSQRRHKLGWCHAGVLNLPILWDAIIYPSRSHAG